ncbi:MAG: response regulator [Thermodesulfobacteriota bacterium]
MTDGIRRGAVLIVDDEPDLVEFVRWQLEERSFRVESALSGVEAIRKLAAKPADVMVADIRMPGMDGIELIRRALEIRPDIQCIVMTGHGEMDTAVAAMRLGAINYLRKPVGIEELEVAVEKGMEKADLIRALQEKTARLEKANLELTRLRRQLENELQKEKSERRAVEEELLKTRRRETAVELMNHALRCWKQSSGKTKIDLAEESRLWSASVDNGGTYRTRTLDRYLSIATLPPNPRFNDVLDTGYFVLNNCRTGPEEKTELERLVRHLAELLSR